MATSTVNYSSNTSITMDLAGLASSTTFVAGRESSQIDNTTNKYVDCIVSGFVSVGTTPTASKSIVVYLWGADTSLATTPIDVLDGTDSAETLTNTGILASLKWGATVSVTAATSDVAYPVLPFSVASRFGGVMPKFWGLFVAHDTVAALRNTAVNTNSFEFVGIKYDIA
jgi:hypothetical protein